MLTYNRISASPIQHTWTRPLRPHNKKRFGCEGDEQPKQTRTTPSPMALPFFCHVGGRLVLHAPSGAWAAGKEEPRGARGLGD